MSFEEKGPGTPSLGKVVRAAAPSQDDAAVGSSGVQADQKTPLMPMFHIEP